MLTHPLSSTIRPFAPTVQLIQNQHFPSTPYITDANWLIIKKYLITKFFFRENTSNLSDNNNHYYYSTQEMKILMN